ncbi:MAG: 3'-5' exonuclease [Halopseudomonas sp.]|uniref:3'-5' exonuclease n=1 Tax=Halopseudomonas sp. TaxID=2901191 RepID=UPI00300363DA
MASPDWPAQMARLADQAKHPILQRFYQAGCVAADCALAEAPLIALDIETTGLDPRRDAIVSLGLLPFSLQRIRCRDALYQVVRPVGELSEESITFHRITHSDVSQAPRMASVLEEVLQTLAGKLVVVHYRAIERGFLDQACRLYLGEGLHFPVIDTMELEARLHRGANEPNWFQRLFGKRQQSIRLADSRLRYNLPLYQAHHALTDALATAELLQAQALTHYPPATAVSKLWS